uniref:Uncharacterized protein n=1 Tax=Anguilla anguilla TaxID=7936 RepID=A0A0E9WXP6_ANGAN
MLQSQALLETSGEDRLGSLSLFLSPFLTPNSEMEPLSPSHLHTYTSPNSSTSPVSYPGSNHTFTAASKVKGQNLVTFHFTSFCPFLNHRSSNPTVTKKFKFPSKDF